MVQGQPGAEQVRVHDDAQRRSDHDGDRQLPAGGQWQVPLRRLQPPRQRRDLLRRHRRG